MPAFVGGSLSCDGGVLILREIEKRLNFAGALASSRPATPPRADQGAQALHKIRPHILPPLAGQPVPAFSSYRRILAVVAIAQV